MDPEVRREVADEQAYVDQVYERLDEAAVAAQELAREGHGRARLGHEGGLVERDAMVFQAARRIAALDAAHEGLVFGRLDLTTDEPRYIGRIGLRDADREVMLVDWRAPAAAVFYQATAQDPAGVVRRRVLRSKGQQVVGVEDELLDAEAAPDDMAVVGDGALLAQLSRARDAYMHSVVDTIQKEQDEAIRSPGRGVTSITGGPGTGKTVVALHRAAYLLYTDRRRFESGGVLVVGPSDVFMSYIERVLPSLGETTVTLRAMGEVVDGLRATQHEEPEVAALKGSHRMRRLLARAARDPVPGAPTEFRAFWRDQVLTLDPKELSGLRRQLLSSGQRRNRALGRVEHALLDLLWARVSAQRALDRGREAFNDELGDDGPVGDFARAWWPPLDAVGVWTWLHQPDRLRRYAAGLFDADEVDRLLASWRSGAERNLQQPSVEDVPLVDELRYLLGDVPVDTVGADDDSPRQPMSFEREEAEQRALRTTQRTEDDGYAHVLVDESQDLSPMQWRMLGRRGRYASWTVVGDLAQAAWPLPDEAAAGRAEALEGKQEHRFRLSTNYRNSAEVFDLAARVVQVAVEDPDLPEAVRRTGVAPEHRVVEPADRAAAIRDAVASTLDATEGTVAVVAPIARRAAVDGLLADVIAGAPRLRVLEPLDAKGLEFDAVVVVEPDELVAESAAGWRTLYVVLTRATFRLVSVGTSRRWLDRIEAVGVTESKPDRDR
ncbi:MAG: AAA family ATPase [Nocardioidaceae bacterium]|nr:AAA family ATPase [Nocardioidaceae bacterium]